MVSPWLVESRNVYREDYREVRIRGLAAKIKSAQRPTMTQGSFSANARLMGMMRFPFQFTVGLADQITSDKVVYH